MNKKKIIALLIATAVLVTVFFVIKNSSPFSKESYLEDYKEFIEEVSNERDSYTDDDWKDADEKYEKYNKEWYDKFESELSWKEKMKITKYSTQYNIYRYSPF